LTGLRLRADRRRLVHARNRWQEAITATGNRLNATAAAATLIENAAECRDLHCEIGSLHNAIGPNGGRDLILRDEIAAVVDQRTEDSDGTRTEADWLE
jgi:hypothetical protein